MKPILTVTLNPCVDFATSAEQVVAGPKLRCAPPHLDPGGGGINVSRAIAILGGISTAFVATGGATGEQLLEMLTAEGLGLVQFDGPGETRHSFSVTDRSGGGQYRFVLPGPEWDGELVDAALAGLGKAMTRGGYVVLSGSQPPGVPTDFAQRLARVAAANGALFVLDTSGAALADFAAAAVPGAKPLAEVLRMNHIEAAELAGHALADRAACADLAQELVSRGLARIVILARGPDGSTLASAETRLHAEAARVKVVSAVGAGDSFVGAFTWSLARDLPLSEALSRGAAAASAAVMTEATRLCLREDAERLIAECPSVPV